MALEGSIFSLIVKCDLTGLSILHDVLHQIWCKTHVLEVDYQCGSSPVGPHCGLPFLSKQFHRWIYILQGMQFICSNLIIRFVSIQVGFGLMGLVWTQLTINRPRLNTLNRSSLPSTLYLRHWTWVLTISFKLGADPVHGFWFNFALGPIWSNTDLHQGPCMITKWKKMARNCWSYELLLRWDNKMTSKIAEKNINILASTKKKVRIPKEGIN